MLLQSDVAFTLIFVFRIGAPVKSLLDLLELSVKKKEICVSLILHKTYFSRVNHRITKYEREISYIIEM